MACPLQLPGSMQHTPLALSVFGAMVIGCVPSNGDTPDPASVDAAPDQQTPTPGQAFALESGHVYISPRAHAEDSPTTQTAGDWVKWTSIPMSTWQARGATVVNWAASHGYTLDLCVTPDAVNAIVAAGAYGGAANWIAWSVAQLSTTGVRAVRWCGRAHDSSKYSAADSVFVLETAGAPYDGVLGSFETFADYAGTIAGKTYPTAPGRHFTILTGGTTTPGHPMQSSWPAGIYAASADQVVVNGGSEDRGTDIDALWRAVDSGTVSIGIRTLQFDLGEKSTRPDGWAVATSGEPIDAAVDAMLQGLTADQRARTHVIGYEQLVKAWEQAGKPAIDYDEATLH